VTSHLYTSNVIGEGLIDEDLPVERENPTPLPVGDEGILIEYGDRETGITVTVAAEDENDAEARILRTFGDDAYVDCVEVIAPLPPDLERGVRNLLHASRPCSDPDCEIHHPDVIETTERLTALAWYEAGRRSQGDVGDPSTTYFTLAISGLDPDEAAALARGLGRQFGTEVTITKGGSR
jgi:hypothetical protein